MKKVLLYNHGTSLNHGCEAIIRTVSAIIENKYPDASFTVSSMKPWEDTEFFTDNKIEFVEQNIMCKASFELRNLITGGCCKIFGGMPFFNAFYKDTVKSAKGCDLTVSVGGDNYSYGNSSALTDMDGNLRKYCPNSILWGCSINSEYMDPVKNKKKIDSLKKFTLISARETITYETLKKLGFENVKYYPDPAFTLPTNVPKKPMFDNDDEIIGINLSPLIQSYESDNNVCLKNYVNLVKAILEKTPYNVALISHVLCKTSNDTESARKIIKHFPGEKRIKIFDKGSCMDIKGYISRCKVLVAARTHASIAAYSNCIPALVVGYSVKAKGIAKDLFGKYEGYVLPVQELKEEYALEKAFFALLDKEDEIKNHLKELMPAYIEKAWAMGDEVCKILGGEEGE